MNVDLPAHPFASKDEHGHPPLQQRKRPLHQDDPFFQEGDYEYKAAWIRLEDANAYIPDLNDSDDDTRTEYSHRLTVQRCHLGKCHGELTFSSPAAYEHHYEINHRHICETCGKPFPGEKWLELHIHEVHNILVKIKREKGEKTYRCFVEGCDRLCSTAAKRRMHLIGKHQYPKQFNFGIVFTGILPFEEKLRCRQSELFNMQEQEGQEVHAPYRLQSSILYKEQYGQRSPTTHVDGDSGAMDIEASATSASRTAMHRNSSSSEAGTAGRATLPKGKEVRGTNAMPPKKQAFVQYRTPKSAKARLGRDRDITRSADQAMEVEPSSVCAAVVSDEGKRTQDRMDTDMDQLQQSMVRLMVPRSVVNRVRK
ncbi:hypothetical protein BGZ67_006726 [Mortierella alpina]|nr:hypothetical protein BGZ67_006726 [Mortierella alpina]